MEKAFELKKVKDEKKAQYASYYLKDDASFWWESSKALLEGKDLLWEKFTEMFLEKYLLSYMQDQLEMKFLDLRQEDMSAKKAKRFQQGLRPWIQSQVALLEIKNYAALVQKAMIVEREREATKRENEGRKRKFESSEQEQGSSKFRGKFGKNGGSQNQKFQKFKPGNGAQKNHFQKAEQPGKDSRPQIQECKKGHYSSECQNGAKNPDLTCFKYGKVGHMARNWWESSKALLEGKDLSWEKFTEMFLEKYLLSYMQDQLEAKKAKRFQQGLRPWIQSQVALLEIKNYAALVQKEMIVKREREAAKRENEGRKRKFESSEQEQGSSKFRGKFGMNGGSQNQKFQKFKPGNGAQKNHFQKAEQPGKDSRPQIQECKKGHYSSECQNGAKKPDLTCFKYGKVGHMARNCKEPVQKANVLRIAGPLPLPAPTAQPRARTFNMTMKDVVQDVDVVAGMLVINSVEVKVLIDSGATRSFISESILHRLNCVAYPLEPNLIVEVANQEKVTINKVCPDCNMVIEGRHLSADLIPFKLGEFDVILEMDWLSNHEEQIECKSKKVKLKTKDGIEVIFKGKR
ncbi:hypothetical protein AgCh_000008 [Apium graveolens]